MNLKTELFLAWRYLKPKRNAVSVITLISLIGVMLGVAVLIVVIAVMTGFTEEMKDKILQTMAHIQVFDMGRAPIKNPDFVLKTIKEAGCEGAPVVNRPALVQRGKNLFPKEVIGLNPTKTVASIPVEKFMTSGSFSLEKGQILLGSFTARELGVGIGDKIIIHSPEKIAKMVNYDNKGKINVTDAKKVYLPDEFEVAGTFSMGKYDFDSSTIIMNIDDADELFDMPWGSATSIFVRVEDPFNLMKELSILREKLGEKGFDVYSWQEMNSQFLGVLDVEKNMMFFLLVFIVLVAAFSISNTLITVVLQKTREVGLIKALGGNYGFIMRVFILQGFLVGVGGTFMGALLGCSVIHWRNNLLFALRYYTGIDIFPAKYYFFSQLPASIVVGDVTVICVVSIILCTIGAFIPAWRAASLDPARALRYE